MSEASASSLGGPRQLGRYEVIAEIARGGMGTVYLARHAGEAGFQRLFAIKLLHAHLAENRVFIDMLLDEARIAARIHHPNVVAIVDLGSDEGRHFVVLEYVDGCAFSTLLLRNRQARPPELVVPIVIDALEGLSAAHSVIDDEGRSLHLVHRDVSPQNILVGADGVARITDFGIAKAEARITSTRPGMRKGKIHYMAPEQFVDDGENIDLRADLFAAGAVLWSALTGRALFRGQSDAATIHNILSREVPPPSKIGLCPPAAFDAVCLRALQRNPDKRFNSALEMADTLRRAAAQHGIISSRANIAGWVSRTLGAELEARRQAIRTAVRSRLPAPGESLPELPTLGSPSTLPPFNPSHPELVTSPHLVGVSGLHPSSQPPGQATTTTHSLNVEAEPDFGSGRRKAAWIAGAVLVPLVIAAAWAATRSDTKAAASAALSASTMRVMHTPPPMTPSVSESVAAAPAEPSTTPATPKPHAHRRIRRVWHRSWVRHARRKPKPSQPQPAPTHSQPPSQPTSGIHFEDNPYLRQK